MAKIVTIQLLDPIEGHGGTVTEIHLREPRGRDLIELGEPYSYARTGKDLVVHAENDAAIRGYLDRCIVPGPKGQPSADPLLAMERLSLADMLAVKEQLLSFFGAARLARAALNSLSPTSTGSTPPAPATSR